RFTSFPNFQKFIDAKTVVCKCGITISLGKAYQVSNFQRHSQSNNCTYCTNNQPSIKVFFSKIESEKDNDDDNKPNNEKNSKRYIFMCQGLNDLEHVNYIINSPASFGGGKKPEIVAKELFPEKFSENASFTRKKLSNKERREFERALEFEATWRLDKEALAIYHMQCEKKTNNKSAICNNCEQLKSNKRLNQALKAKQATSICYLKVVVNMKFLEKLLLDFQFKEFDSTTITNPDLILENFIKFSQIVSSINWNGPIVVMTDSTKLRPKLVYA
ncbi:3689_t:CDS:2, partial [Dentiscutata heterogama]